MTAAISVETCPTALPARNEVTPSLLLRRAALYVELIKPRIAMMVGLTVAAGFVLASPGTIDAFRLIAGVLGICLTAAASSVWNQVLERDTDQLMTRTAGRPLPTGRISSPETAWFGTALLVVGVVWLWMVVNPLTAVLSMATCLSYVLIYTPLKRRSILATTIGAIPGAMPPVLGWTAAGGQLDAGALALFALLFVWQFPHFLAIAWLYREQYSQAGLRMWPRDERVAVLTQLTYAAVLIPVSLLPRAAMLAGGTSTVVAVLAGLWYLIKTFQFTVLRTPTAARSLIHTSLIHLPLVLTAFAVDHWRLLQ